MDPQGEKKSDFASLNSARARRRLSFAGSVIAVIALLALGWLAWHLAHSGNSSGGSRFGFGGRGGPPATTVGVATAATADIPVTLEALGTVNAAATATVRPQVSGVLQKISFREGQMVKAGEVLAEIDPRPFEMSLMQASGQRQRDEAQLDAARITLERYRTLLQQDSIARQDVDTQAALVKQLEGATTSDRAQEGIAKINLGYSRIAAPLGGRVGLRAVDVGNVIGPGDANGLVVITQLSPINVAFAIPQDRVDEVQASLVKGKDIPVTVLDRTRTTVLDTGKFLALDNLVDVQTGTVKAKAVFPNAKGSLFPSQFVNVRLLLDTVHAIVVPVTALRHGSNGDYVYVLNAADRTVSQRPVTRGHATVDKVEIASGLKVGEQVITEGADRLKDGAHVMLPGDKPSFGGGQGKGGGKGHQGAWAQKQGSADASASPSGAPDAARREAWRKRRQQQSESQ